MITSPLILIRFRPDLDSWRQAAHYLLQQGAQPSSIDWMECAPGESPTPLPDLPPARWNEDFLALAQRAACHRSSDRWPLLYRVLWRLVHGHSRLLNEKLDADVNRLLTFGREVDKEVRHLLHTIQFTPVEMPTGTVQVATFHPKHHVIELAAPQLARQWGDTHWSLLTPERCVAWNGHQLLYSSGTGMKAELAATRDSTSPAESTPRATVPVNRFQYRRHSTTLANETVAPPRQMELL